MNTATDSRKGRLSKDGIVYMLKRTLQEFLRDGGTDQAAKLTYFMVLSIAPTLLAVFSLAALLLRDIQDQIAQLIKDGITSASGGMDVGGAVDSTLDSLMGSTAGGTVGLIIGIGTALWSASAYVKAFGRAANDMYDVPEGRNFVRSTLTMLAVTLAIIVGLFLVFVSILLNETLVDALVAPIAGPLGVSGAVRFLMVSFLPIWAWVKWPVILLLLFMVVSLLYWAAPNVARPFRLISPGGVLAIVGTAIAGVAIAIYMSTVASYSSYGAIGGLMAVLFALWIVNIVLVLGAELDAEFERAKELEHGRPAEESLSVGLRGEKAAVKAEEKHEKLVEEGRDLRLRNLHENAKSYTAPETRLDEAALGSDTSQAAEAPQDPRAADAAETAIPGESADASQLSDESGSHTVPHDDTADDTPRR